MSTEPRRKGEHVLRAVWRNMKARCYDKSAINYERYGAKGVTICDSWLESFDNFLEDMGERPTPRHTLDRIDNKKGYFKDNCRWATYKEQNNNSSRNRRITINGITKNLSQWIELSGIKSSTVHQRFYAYGWSIEKSLGLRERG